MSDDACAEPRMSFDRGARAYHQGRPPYPDAVYELLASEYGLAPGCRVLEVGAGSGTATDVLLSHGAEVTAVEPGINLARLLRQRHPAATLTVVTADFEQAVLPAVHYDLCVAATSWHWLDPKVAVPKTARLLRSVGGLVIWWTIFGDPDRKHTEFRSALDPLYLRYLPGEVDDGRPPKPLRANEWQAQLQAGGWFEPASMELVRWTQQLTAASACALWATFPNVAELPKSDRNGFLAGVADAVEAAGGVVDDPRLTVVYHTRRRPGVDS